MIGVISGLVAVVLVVLMVVALGMRSMNRRESALSAERIKAMAENKGPKPRRPAEETFFESFPQGFDAFEEPAEPAKQPRPGSARQGGGRQARAAERGGKQAAAAGARGKRGVDEWGEHDDYDDDYWSRVRADDGGFGGSIAARVATPRPAEQPAEAEATTGAAADPNAATMQVPLPQRPVPAGLADLVETSQTAAGTSRGRAKQTPAASTSTASASMSASALAEQKTVTFSAPTPTPDALGTSPSRGRSSRAGSRSTRSGGRRSAAAAEAGRTSASGSFEAPSAPMTSPATPMPTTGAFSAGSYETPLGTGPFEATPPTAATPAAGTGSASTWPSAYEPSAYDSPHGDAYDLSRNATGPFSPADTGPSYPVTPPTSANHEAGSNPASTTSPGWPSMRDVLDEPEPPRPASSSWPAVETYQMPQTQTPPPSPVPSAYDGYSATAAAPGDGVAYGSVPPSTPSSYEVSAGWATIDESDTVTGAVPTASPYESAGYDVPSGQSNYYGYEQQQGGYGTEQAASSSWQEQNTGGNWPTYDEMYGDTQKPTTARRGSHRSEPETDYPDYYR
ncbi:hypothetical protein [Sphaerimonospora thailandensis]|uniref:Uncharacterized protein n=1 Tax=Sphaerimonospora thailandensis TaxID=795644 RepID=A0A8J3VXY0_9ACTN|nr:hypothetical protein [Sphaerimonospora thailandensis]GIH69379.1 hypothetical protein Mth01_16320 [Sphaerimonospora thailandensis]